MIPDNYFTNSNVSSWVSLSLQVKVTRSGYFMERKGMEKNIWSIKMRSDELLSKL